jgi:uncharacterized protein
MSTIVHFDIPADEPQRAKKFYESLFGWTITAPPGYPDYYLFGTTDEEGKTAVGGGLGKRGAPDQKITVYFSVNSIAEYLSRIETLGGAVIMPYTPVPGFGALAICMDTEKNPFGLWETQARTGA